MNDLQIIIEGTSKIHDIDIPNIYGGFGPKQKSILAKDLASLHQVETKYINKLINNNIKNFEFGIEIMDLKTGSSKELVLSLGFTNAQYGNAKNIYLLSERGYLKLIKYMTTPLAEEIYNEMLDDYFYYREKEEITFEAEALDRIKNGFNYKEIEKFIDDNPEGITEFKLQDLSEWVPSGKYPKSLIKIILETEGDKFNDNEINNLFDKTKKPGIALRSGDKIKEFLSNNAIPYNDDVPRKLIIYDKEYSKSSITFYSEEEVITIILALQNNRITEHVRKELLKQSLIHIIPINNVALTEKEKELTAKCEELEDTISDLKDELKASRKATENLNNTIQNLEKEKQAAYETGIEEGKKQARKEKGKNLFNNIKDSVKKAKKWIENKLGGDESPQVEIKTEVNRYGDLDSNRIKPKADIDTNMIGKPQPINIEKASWNTLRGVINEMVISAAEIQNKDAQDLWNELHDIIRTEFRNNNRPLVKRSIPGTKYTKRSFVNDYTLQELRYATTYCNEIILGVSIS